MGGEYLLVVGRGVLSPPFGASAFPLSVLPLCCPSSPSPCPLQVRYIKALVQKRLGFRFGMELLGDDEDDEYAPVVVET